MDSKAQILDMSNHKRSKSCLGSPLLDLLSLTQSTVVPLSVTVESESEGATRDLPRP